MGTEEFHFLSLLIAVKESNAWAFLLRVILLLQLDISTVSYQCKNEKHSIKGYILVASRALNLEKCLKNW